MRGDGVNGALEDSGDVLLRVTATKQVFNFQFARGRFTICLFDKIAAPSKARDGRAESRTTATNHNESV